MPKGKRVGETTIEIRVLLTECQHAALTARHPNGTVSSWVRDIVADYLNGRHGQAAHGDVVVPWNECRDAFCRHARAMLDGGAWNVLAPALRAFQVAAAEVAAQHCGDHCTGRGRMPHTPACRAFVAARNEMERLVPQAGRDW